MFSYSRRFGRIVPAIFTIILFTFSASFAQEAAPTGQEFFGTNYDANGYNNSLLNLKAKPAQAARPSGAATGGQLDTAFNPVMDNTSPVGRATARQADGKIIVGGFFRTIGGQRRDNIVRLNSDLSFDNSFAASANGGVFGIAVQADGKIVIVGNFTAVNGTGQNYVARLFPDGSVDTSFNTGGGASGPVNDVAVAADGKIVIGGTFTAVGGLFRPYVARLNADGSVDTGFTPSLPTPFPPNFIPSIVYSLAVQPDGKVLIAGFIYKTPFPSPTVSPIVRLNTDGSIDGSFAPAQINSNAYKVILQPDGKILVGGAFSTYAATSRNRIIRLESNGNLDTTFVPGTGFDGFVYTLALRPDGKIVAGGVFGNYNGTQRNDLALLNSDGSLDTSFSSEVFTAGVVYNVFPLADGRLLFGGSFTILGGPVRDTFVVLGPTGALDTNVNLNSTAKGGTRAIAFQPDGKMVVGGNFTRVDGISHVRVVRFNTDGSVDPSFDSSTVGINALTTLAIQPDGKILVSGIGIFQNTVSGPSTPLARLNANGTYDTTFALGVAARTGRAIALQPDGKIVFSYSTPVLAPFPQGDTSRLNPDGSVDSSFDGMPLLFDAMVVQPDGSILAGGATGITYVNSTTGQSEAHNGIMKMTSDGSHDRTFRSGFVSNTEGAGFTSVSAIERLPDGKILVGGSLYTSASTSPVAVARLNPTGTVDGSFSLNTISSTYEFPRAEDIHVLPNGKIMVAGLFNHIGLVAQNNIVRMTANGAVDSSFVANTDGTIFDVAVNSAGKVLIGGDFENVNGLPRTGLARLLGESLPRRTAFDFDGDGRSDISVFRPLEGNWYIQQSTAGYTGTHFGITTDKLVPADYDADGKTDVAVFRDGAWYLMGSTSGFRAYTFGQAGDIPQPADFNGDGQAELCVFRPSDGGWYKLDLNGNVFTAVIFGTNGDKPVVGDYDGDGKADPAVYRGGAWYILGSIQGYYGVNFGIATDKVVPADYDGDGKTDQAVVRDGFWYLLQSTAGYTGFQWGLSTDTPVAADYDGDGKADVSVYRDGQWYLLQSTAGYAGANFGLPTDTPVPNSFVQ